MQIAVLDACCLVNLCATGNVQGILLNTGYAWHLPDAVEGEVTYIRTASDGTNAGRWPVGLHECVGSGTLIRCKPTNAAETALYVQLAADLDDGEAMAMAIAHQRGWLLATDDRKARRRAAELAVSVVTTPEIMRLWAESGTADRPAIRTALLNVQSLARFTPTAAFPQYEWWIKSLR